MILWKRFDSSIVFLFFITLYNTFTYHNFTAIWVVNICQGGALAVQSQLSDVRIWPVVSELQQRLFGCGNEQHTSFLVIVCNFKRIAVGMMKMTVVNMIMNWRTAIKGFS